MSKKITFMSKLAALKRSDTIYTTTETFSPASHLASGLLPHTPGMCDVLSALRTFTDGVMIGKTKRKYYLGIMKLYNYCPRQPCHHYQ